MSNMWNNFMDFWVAYAPWLGAVLIPALITGLTISAKTEKAAGWLPKIWSGFKMLMDFLSVVTHKDRPGTFQLPLKAGVVVSKVLPKKEDAGPAALILVLFLSPAQSGCSWLKGGAEEAKDVAINCALITVMASARDLVPTVFAIVSGGSTNWKHQMKTVSKEFGRDAAACALKHVVEKLEGGVQSEPEGDPEAERKAALVRARAYSLEAEWRYAE